VQVVLINIATLSYMIGYGVQSTICAVIGNEIGKGEAFRASQYYKVVNATLALILVLMTILFY
jgi:Na+-driven multidrug efflux pump